MQKELKTLIKLHDISLIKDKSIILENINFSIKEGEIISIIGPNGAGKTSLLKLIIGSISSSTGSIEKITNLKIGYVPQKINIDSILPLTVDEFTGSPKHLIEYLEIENLGKKFIYSLSGGELQRVLLCRALTRNPDLLLLDESSQGLDISGILKFYKLIDKINKEMNTTIIMVSHDLNIVLNRADEIICLNKHICCKGKSNNISLEKGFIDLFGNQIAPEIGLYRHNHKNDYCKCKEG